MKTISTVILLVLYSKTILAGAQLTGQNYDWFLQNYEYVNKLLETNNTREVIPVINTLGTMWKYKDGAIGSEISGAISKAIIYHSKFMFSWFVKHPKQLTIWNQRLQHDLLTNYSATEAQSKILKKLKIDLEIALEKYVKVENDIELKQAANQMLQKLKPLKVREIE